MRIEAPERTTGLVTYWSTQYLERFFCGTCGCHVFWRGVGPEEDIAWAVATGVIEGYAGDAGPGHPLEGDAGSLPEPQYGRHINVVGTKDGGLSTFLPDIRGRTMDDTSRWGEQGDEVIAEIGTGKQEVLPASCHCGKVSFHVTRPDRSSSVPKRGHTDLIHPYCSTPPDIAANPGDEKWWLRLPRPETSSSQAPEAENRLKPTRYLAGACACRSCRLVSGFEIQCWAFVPRSNIFLHVPLRDTTDPGTTGTISPLDFNTLPPGILKSYHSSPGVVRDFCASCGATVFWRDNPGGEVVDISAGLFDAVEGSRAEDWLDWWTGRVSFSEEAKTGRTGEVAARAEGLIESLEKGMRERAERRG